MLDLFEIQIFILFFFFSLSSPSSSFSEFNMKTIVNCEQQKNNCYFVYLEYKKKERKEIFSKSDSFGLKSFSFFMYFISKLNLTISKKIYIK